jgi:hypothetical protein
MTHNLPKETKEIIDTIDTKETKEIIDTIDIKEGIVNHDNYTQEVLLEQYRVHKDYVKKRIEMKRTGIRLRLPSIPEDISENMIKFIIHHKLQDRTSTWNCVKGDLYSLKEGYQECKCFTSTGPISFSPISKWNVIYFLDATQWLEDKFIVYRCSLEGTSLEWQHIKVNKKQMFQDQSIQKRRPRLQWNLLYPQIRPFCTKIFEGNFDEIFVPMEDVLIKEE